MLTHSVIIQAESLHHPWTKILHEHVTLLSHLQDGVTRRRLFEVEDNTTLIAVEVDKPRPESGFKGHAQVTQDVTNGSFDFNDISSHVCHHHGTKRAGDNTAQI